MILSNKVIMCGLLNQVVSTLYTLLAASKRRRGITVASRLLATIGPKLVGPHGGLHVGKCHANGNLDFLLPFYNY